MKEKEFYLETDLAALAKKYRQASGKKKVEVAREMGVKPPSIHYAEENPEMSYLKLRRKMIESYSPFKIVGPVYWLQKK